MSILKGRGDGVKLISSHSIPTHHHHAKGDSKEHSLLSKASRKRLDAILAKDPELAERYSFSPDELEHIWKLFADSAPKALSKDFRGLDSSGFLSLTPRLKEWSRVAKAEHQPVLDWMFSFMVPLDDSSSSSSGGGGGGGGDARIHFVDFVAALFLFSRAPLSHQLERVFDVLVATHAESSMLGPSSSSHKGLLRLEVLYHFVLGFGNFLEYVSLATMAHKQLDSLCTRLEVDLFYQTDVLDKDAFLKRALNNKAVHYAIGLLHHAFGSVVKNIELEIGHTRVFGLPLSRVPTDDRGLPLVVTKCTAFLLGGGSDHRPKHLGEGLFRVSSPVEQMEQLCSQLESDVETPFPDGLSPHLVADVLKTFLRMLPEPPCTFAFYHSFLELGKTFAKRTSLTDAQKLRRLRGLVSSLPQVNVALLAHVGRFVLELSTREESTRMGQSSLELIFAPLMLRSDVSETDPHKMAEEASDAQEIYHWMLRFHDGIFEDLALSHTAGDMVEVDPDADEVVTVDEYLERAMGSMAEMFAQLKRINNQKNDEVSRLRSENEELRAQVADLQRQLARLAEVETASKARKLSTMSAMITPVLVTKPSPRPPHQGGASDDGDVDSSSTTKSGGERRRAMKRKGTLERGSTLVKTKSSDGDESQREKKEEKAKEKKEKKKKRFAKRGKEDHSSVPRTPAEIAKYKEEMVRQYEARQKLEDETRLRLEEAQARKVRDQQRMKDKEKERRSTTDGNPREDQQRTKDKEKERRLTSDGHHREDRPSSSSRRRKGVHKAQTLRRRSPKPPAERKGETSSLLDDASIMMHSNPLVQSKPAKIGFSSGGEDFESSSEEKGNE